MRNKKSNMIYYIIAATLVLAVCGAVVLEVPLSQEHVEQTIK